MLTIRLVAVKITFICLDHLIKLRHHKSQNGRDTRHIVQSLARWGHGAKNDHIKAVSEPLIMKLNVILALSDILRSEKTVRNKQCFDGHLCERTFNRLWPICYFVLA